MFDTPPLERTERVAGRLEAALEHWREAVPLDDRPVTNDALLRTWFGPST